MSKIKYLSVPVSLRVNSKTRTKINEKTEQLRRLGHPAVTADAEKFVCLDCSVQWDWTDMSSFFDPNTVTCSNCYGDRVMITSIRVELESEASFKVG